MIRQPDGNRTYIGEPLILDHMNIDVGYADFTKFAIKAYDQPPQLFIFPEHMMTVQEIVSILEYQ